MKTPATPANLAIVALARSIASDCSGLAALAIEAEEAAEIGDLNLTIGTLLPLQQRLELLKAQFDAITALHRGSHRA